jgi:hypothetical protein
MFLLDLAEVDASTCVVGVFPCGFTPADVQVAVYKVSKETKLKKLSNKVLFARSEIECAHHCELSDCCAASYNC